MTLVKVIGEISVVGIDIRLLVKLYNIGSRFEVAVVTICIVLHMFSLTSTL